jgi:hypothetical protein
MAASAAQAQATQGGNGGSITRIADDAAEGRATYSPAVHRLMVNGKPVRVDVAPQAINGTMMVPIRFVSEYLGGKVHWDPAKRQVHAWNGPKHILMNIDSTQAYLGSEGRALSQAPVIRDGRTLIPLRDMANFFDAEVAYNHSAHTVFVTVASNTIPPPRDRSVTGMRKDEVR